VRLNRKVCRGLRPPEGRIDQLVAADPELWQVSCKILRGKDLNTSGLLRELFHRCILLCSLGPQLWAGYQ
jgi:hypothetical protein